MPVIRTAGAAPVGLSNKWIAPGAGFAGRNRSGAGIGKWRWGAATDWVGNGLDWLVDSDDNPSGVCNGCRKGKFRLLNRYPSRQSFSASRPPGRASVPGSKMAAS